MIVGEGGFVSYLGTNDAMEVEKRADSGDELARFIQEALFYQVSKMIGEMAVVLDGNVDAIILTGGMAFNKSVADYIRSKTNFIAPLYSYPGEDELEALALNALRVARNEIEVKEYKI